MRADTALLWSLPTRHSRTAENQARNVWDRHFTGVEDRAGWEIWSGTERALNLEVAGRGRDWRVSDWGLFSEPRPHFWHHRFSLLEKVPR